MKTSQQLYRDFRRLQRSEVNRIHKAHLIHFFINLKSHYGGYQFLGPETELMLQVKNGNLAWDGRVKQYLYNKWKDEVTRPAHYVYSQWKEDSDLPF